MAFVRLEFEPLQIVTGYPSGIFLFQKLLKNSANYADTNDIESKLPLWNKTRRPLMGVQETRRAPLYFRKPR